MPGLIWFVAPQQVHAQAVDRSIPLPADAARCGAAEPARAITQNPSTKTPSPSVQEAIMLKGKSAVVTGSTSGIGLAIARALAKEGANVMINGFGDKAAIETERAGIEKDFGVKAIYSGADMSKPPEIVEMIKTAEKT